MATGCIGGRVRGEPGQGEREKNPRQGQEDEQDLAPGKVLRERLERRARVIHPHEAAGALALDASADSVEPRLGGDRVARELRVIELNVQLAADRRVRCEDGRGHTWGSRADGGRIRRGRSGRDLRQNQRLQVRAAHDGHVDRWIRPGGAVGRIDRTEDEVGAGDRDDPRHPHRHRLATRQGEGNRVTRHGAEVRGEIATDRDLARRDGP